MQDIWHKRLKSLVFQTGNVLCPFKVFGGFVGTAFSRVVYKILNSEASG
jgi:hypothetical protein